MNARLFLTAFLGLFLVGCKIQLKVPSGEPMFKIKTSPCFGECPVYEMEIYPNRIAHFSGKEFTQKEGSWLRKLDKDEFSSLEEMLDSSRFFSLQDEYDNPGVSDFPSTYLTYQSKGRSKSIHCRFNVPESLTEIIKYINQIRNNDTWTKQGE